MKLVAAESDVAGNIFPANLQEPTPVTVGSNIDTALEELKKLSLEELTQIKVVTETTVSRVDERIDTAPGSIYVYTREVIQMRGYRSLGELLETVPGFTVFHRDLQFVAGVRGLNANDNEKIALLVNGQYLNNVHEPDFLNGPINLDNVERVEVVVGPSSFFQQANTLSATINVITKDINGTEVIGATGNDLPYAGTLMTGRRWASDRSVTFSFTTEQRDGFDAWARDFRRSLAGRRQTGQLDWPSYFSVLKGKYGEWSGQAVAKRSTWPELNINSGARSNEGEFTDQFYSALIKNEHPWTADLTSIFQVDATLKQTSRENLDGPPANALEQVLNQVSYTAEAGVRYTGFTRQLIQTGIQGSLEDNFDNWFTFNSDTGERIGRTTLYDKDTHGIGIYAADTYRATDWLKLIGGLRLDQNTRLEGDRWFPGARAAIVLEPTSNWVSKVIYNRAVRFPSSLAALNGAWGRGNPNSPSFATISRPPTEPEVLSTFELQNIIYLGRVRLAAAVYHQELENFITWFQPHSNGGNFRGNGAELSVLAPLRPGLSVWANGAVDDSTLNLFRDDLFGAGAAENELHHAYVNTSGRIIGSATYTARGGFDWEIMPNLTFSPAVRYFTDQAAVDHTSNRYISIRHRYYLDVGLAYRNIRVFRETEMDVRISGRNLLDNRDPVGAQLTGDVYRPRGIEAVLAVNLRF